MEKVDILAIGAHPDDIELSCSGTLLHHIALGQKVGLLDLTRGELGSRGSAELRTQEGIKAAALLGASFRENADMADGFFSYDRPHLEKIIRVIRASQPRIVLANALTDRHPDHGRAAKLIADACFYSGLIRIETFGPDGKSQEAWRPESLYHYIQDRQLEPDFVIDISPYIDRKMEVVMAFGSQFYNPDNKDYENEPQTPISGKQFADYLRARAATFGRVAGFDYAEAYNCSRTLGVKNLFDLV